MVPGARTIRTGTRDARRVRSAILPRTQRLTPERPWVAMMLQERLCGLVVACFMDSKHKKYVNLSITPLLPEPRKNG